MSSSNSTGGDGYGRVPHGGEEGGKTEEGGKSKDGGAQHPLPQTTTSAPVDRAKVRFSLEVEESSSEGLRRSKVANTSARSIGPSEDGEGLPTRDPGSGFPPLMDRAAKTVAGSPSHGRHRGYSLRRSLFAQKLQNQSADRESDFEMGVASLGGDSDLSHRSLDPAAGPKRETSITVTEAVTEDDGWTPANAVPRLSDPIDELPLYQRRLAKQRSRRTVSQRCTMLYREIRDGLMRRHTIPPSVDGRHIHINVPSSMERIDERTQKAYVSNIIRSCRYTPLNFVPRQLVAQFGKLANFYFLCVSVLQMIPGLSTTGTYTTIIPLLIFVGISMAKEGYDDIRRQRLDKEENERLTKVLNVDHALETVTALGPKRSEGLTFHTGSPQWRREKWQDVRVGDVVLLERDAAVPADLILLRSGDPTGTAYIETKSLDGETNLKSKRPLVEISRCCGTAEAMAQMDAEFVVEDPNLDLYKFEGRVSVGGQTWPLTNTEVIYRGSTLRNTPWAMGLVIYSGEECKIRMNANSNPRVKAPSMQALVNKVVVFIALLVVFIAVIMTVAYQIWRRTTENEAWYLNRARVALGQILTSFIIMFNTMLPLSLYISLEIVKVAQMFLMDDVDMYDAESDTPMEPRTSTINEELGQVSHIFSDKTGTLTNNSMRFRKMSVAGTAWLHDVDLQEEAADEAGRQKLLHKKRAIKGKGPGSRRRQKRVMSHGYQRLHTPAGSTGAPPAVDGTPPPSSRNGPWSDDGLPKTDEFVDYLQRRPQTARARKYRFFLLCLALCHTGMPEKDDDGLVSFQAASPDELALVTAAHDLGYTVTDRQAGSITVKSYPRGDDEAPQYETFEILDVLEFSSARKRMSIIVRFPDQRICLISKGADTTVRNLLRLSRLAASNVAEVARRASQRKSLEVQEVLRRKSVQIKRGASFRRSSSDILGRQGSVSIDGKHTTRDSIDQWLKERESDVDYLKAQRRSSQFYTPRASAQIATPGISASFGGRATWGPLTSSPRTSFQDDVDPLIHENDEDVTDDDDGNVVMSDQAVFERCFQHIDDFATEGLRTLLYGYRYISEEEYATWKSVQHAAATSLVDRQEKMERAGEVIEKDLELGGATAIEDKLQKGVPDAIDRLRRAGIKLWMLTGDKRETAITIGHSCRLIKDYSTLIVLDHELGDLHARMRAAVADIMSHRTAHSVLVVDGQTLTLIDADQASKALFTDLAIRADAVICCRASPSQKASLVRTIRTKVKGSVTLAIGDGANDIAMIQEAHLGIGIAGKEGLQAARTADYSIAQFRFLLKLLLVHGRWNYVRICKYTLGTFWKEMMFYLVQALYQRWNGYTGTSLYEPWSLSMFNTLFTSLPVIFMGVFEKDLAASTLLAVPELYSLGQRNGGFNFRLYGWWATLAVCEALIVYFTMYSIYGEALFTRDNQLYAMGSLAFSSCVVIISVKLQVIELHNKSVAAVIALVLSIGGWWMWNLLLSAIYPVNAIYSVNHRFLDGFGRNPLWWLTLLLIVMSVSLLEIMIKAIGTALSPTDVDIFQAYEQDREVRKRFEEAAADLLQQGWDRGRKKSSLELARETAAQAEREAQVQALLARPRTMEERKAWVRRRHSAPVGNDDGDVKSGGRPEEMEEIPRKSLDVAELFRQGFGSVRQGPDLR